MNNLKSNFNLIPKEIYSKREQKRQSKDKTIFFSAVFPFLAIVVWLIFLLLRLNVKQDIDAFRIEKSTIESQLEQYEPEKRTNAELVLKTRLLKDIVKNDVNPEDFFRIVQDTINESGKPIKVLEYGKDNVGDFTIVAEADDVVSITDMVRIFRDHARLEEVKLKSITYPINNANNTNPKHEFEMAFKILAEQE